MQFQLSFSPPDVNARGKPSFWDQPFPLLDDLSTFIGSVSRIVRDLLRALGNQLVKVPEGQIADGEVVVVEITDERLIGTWIVKFSLGKAVQQPHDDFSLFPGISFLLIQRAVKFEVVIGVAAGPMPQGHGGSSSN